MGNVPSATPRPDPTAPLFVKGSFGSLTEPTQALGGGTPVAGSSRLSKRLNLPSAGFLVPVSLLFVPTGRLFLPERTQAPGQRELHLKAQTPGSRAAGLPSREDFLGRNLLIPGCVCERGATGTGLVWGVTKN